MKKILFATSYNSNDTTSWLRAYGPFTLMRDEVEIILPRLEYNPDGSINMNRGWWNNWCNWVGVDVCFLHRPYGLIAGAIMNAAKIHHVPLWVDHDDDLLAIPESNPYYKEHKDGEAKFPSILMSYKDADILTCSGKLMHDDLVNKYNRPDAIHITTGLDDRFVKFKRPFIYSNKISWRGSTSHMSDLETVKDLLSSVFKIKDKIDWHWFGIDPRKIWGKNLDINGEIYLQMNLFMFIQKLCEVNASIQIVPLADNVFNRVKSNLSWLDGTLAGSVVLAPNFPEFHRPGIETYDEFDIDLINCIDTDCSFLEGLHNESWSFIKDCLLTSKLNEKRRDILKNL